MEDTKEFEVDLLGLLSFLRKKITVLITVTAIFALAAFVINAFFVTPKYTASTRVYILNRSNDQALNSSDFSVSNYVLMDYTVLITGRNVADKVIDKLNLNITADDLADMIKVTSQSNTRVLQINVSDTDPQRAAEIANCVREEASVQIKQIMDVDTVNLVYEAQVPSSPSSPDTSARTLIWAAIGLIGSLAMLTVIFVLDDAIRTEDDVTRYLGLGTLGVIPQSSDLNTEAKKSERARNRSLLKGGFSWKK